MPDVLVITTPATAPGFRLGGARTIVVSAPEQTVAAVGLAVEDGDVAIIAVHGSLWAAVPTPVREGWARLARPLVIALPDTDGDAAAARDAALRDLLARAVGYQITFTPQGGTP